MPRKLYKLHLYKAEDGFRWRMRASNGKIVADSGEAYTTRAKAKKAAINITTAVIDLVEDDGKVNK